MEVVELMKSSSARDQMEMMTIMKQLNKLPGLLGSSCNTTNTPEIRFSGRSTAGIETTTPTIFHNNPSTTSNAALTSITFPSVPFMGSESSLQKRNSMEAMREMIFGIAVMQPIQIDPESVKPRKRRNVKISKDPQSVAARHRRERISEKIRILQRLVPGGTKMDTASMLEEAIQYVKFLKKHVHSLEQAAAATSSRPVPVGGGVVGFSTSTAKLC